VAKQLWKLRWSLLKKPANLSGEEKQAIAVLEREDAGFVHRFRSIIRQLVNIFDYAHSEAQAKLKLHQLREEINAVDDDHLQKSSPSLRITGIRLCGICGKRGWGSTGVGPTLSRGCVCCADWRKTMTGSGLQPPGNTTFRYIRRLSTCPSTL